MLDATQQDRLFRFAAVVKGELDSSGAGLALVARAGLDLSRFSVRYSHAGISLRASQNTPWSVRQLYYACDEQRPRLYDQGLAGFVLGADDPSTGYLSVLLLPALRAAELEPAALSNRQAMQLLGAEYSANAYPFDTRYQNCNQWVIEMIAASWGALGDVADLRGRAQHWLKERGYAPSTFDVGLRPLTWLAAAVPWLHNDDHPVEDLAQHRYRVSMPASIDAFVRVMAPGASRIEFCHNEQHIVVRRGWEPLPDGCVPGPQDTVIALDAPGVRAISR